MIRKIILVFLVFGCTVIPVTSFSYIISDTHPSAIVGLGYTRVKSGQNLWLAQTPEPGLENNFTRPNNPDAFFLGLALDKAYATRLKNFTTSVGVEMDYLKTGGFNGVVHPMVNVAPDFDTLNYSYNLNSYLLFADAQLTQLNILCHIGAYVQGGIGGGVNHLYDYTETSPPESSAYPMLAPFNDGYKFSFAYFVGAGVVWDVPNSMQLSVGYRYVNSGEASFTRTPVQQTNNRLGFSFSHQFLIVSIRT